MELRTVDPRTLAENPDNPRRRAAPDQADLQMAATARAIGILQPPVAREVEGKLMTVYGHRRVRGAIAAEMAEIRVLVLGEDEDIADDEMRAVVENTVRKQMSAVEQWRAIEKLISQRWTEEAISTALVLPMRTLRKLRLLAGIHSPMLDRMHAGDMPRESDLRTIASASPEEQAAAWKKHKPKKGEEVSWWQLSTALTRQRMRAADAVFDAEFAAAYGVEYVEDLFAPAGEDSRTTTNVEGFLAAQHAWVEANLPPNGVVLQTGQYGGPQLPPKANRFYGKPGNGESVGYCVNEKTGQVESVPFTVPAPAGKGQGRDSGGADGTPALPVKPRPDVTQKGQAMIGDMRTDALHAALRDEPIGDGTMIALLVLALAGSNVEVKTGLARGPLERDSRATIAGTLTEGGAITSDPAVLQQAARAMLAYALSCRENWSQSGAVARLAGDAIGADSHLPNMATPEFLSCLSKAAMEGVALGLDVPVQPTGKATRGAVIARVGEGRWVYPQAVFSGGEGAMAAEVASEQRRASWMAGTAGSEADDAADTLPDEDSGGDGLDDHEAVAGFDPAEDAGVGLEDEPEPDAAPAAPPRRRRSRKDPGETQAAA